MLALVPTMVLVLAATLGVTVLGVLGLAMLGVLGLGMLVDLLRMAAATKGSAATRSSTA